MGDMDGKFHCLSSDGRLAKQTSPCVNCFASYFSTCSALNVCKRPSGSSPSPKMLPSGPVVLELLRNHVNSLGFTEDGVHLCFFNKLPAALSRLNYLAH